VGYRCAGGPLRRKLLAATPARNSPAGFSSTENASPLRAKPEVTMNTHARPDVPQPDPVVHDKPGDLPHVPCPDELDDYKPGAVQGGQTTADEEPEPT
jgi:hypothetical protein